MDLQNISNGDEPDTCDQGSIEYNPDRPTRAQRRAVASAFRKMKKRRAKVRKRQRTNPK